MPQLRARADTLLMRSAAARPRHARYSQCPQVGVVSTRGRAEETIAERREARDNTRGLGRSVQYCDVARQLGAVGFVCRYGRRGCWVLRVPSALTVHAAALLVGASVSSAARRPLVHIPRDACLALPGSCLSPSSRRRCNPSLCAALPRIVHRCSSPHPVVLRRLVPAQTEQSTCLQRHVTRHHSKRASHSSAARDCIFTAPVPRTPTPRPDQPCHILHVHVHIHGKQLSPPANEPGQSHVRRRGNRRVASHPYRHPLHLRPVLSHTSPRSRRPASPDKPLP